MVAVYTTASEHHQVPMLHFVDHVHFFQEVRITLMCTVPESFDGNGSAILEHSFVHNPEATKCFSENP
jgi:hypothetical protein